MIDELTRLRPQLREAGEKYVARLEAELFQVAEALRARDLSDAPPRVRRGLGKIREGAVEIALKPEKARRKDLKKVEDFLEKAWETVEGW